MATSQPVVVDNAGRHFACFPAAVLVTVINDAEEVLLLSHPQREGHWEIVKGGIEAGETIQEAALREVKEELGAEVYVEPAGIVHAVTVCHDENIPHIICVFCLMTYRGGTICPGDDMVGSRFRWWDLNAILDETMRLDVPSEKWIIKRAIELFRLGRGNVQ